MPCPESACSTFFLFFTLLHCQQDDKWGKNTGCCLDCSAAVLWTTYHRYQPVAYVWTINRKHWYIIILLLLAFLVLTAVSRGTENIRGNDSSSIMWLPISACVLTNVLMETVTDWNKIWVIHRFLQFDHFEKRFNKNFIGCGSLRGSIWKGNKTLRSFKCKLQVCLLWLQGADVLLYSSETGLALKTERHPSVWHACGLINGQRLPVQMLRSMMKVLKVSSRGRQRVRWFSTSSFYHNN